MFLAEAEGSTAAFPMTSDGGAKADPRVKHTSTVMEGFVLLNAVFGNSMLLILMRSKRMTQYSFSVYFTFAAIFDTCTIFWEFLQDAYELSHVTLLEADSFPVYTFGCGLLELFDGWFVTTSSWLVVAICVDRYISICHPSAAQSFCRRKVALFVCSVLVTCSFVYGLPWSLIVPDKADIDPSDGPVVCGGEPDDNIKGLNITVDYIQLLIPVVIVTVLNIRVLMTLRRKKAFRNETSLTEHGRKQNRMDMYNVSIFYLLVITVLFWLPWMIVNMIESIYFDYEGHEENTEFSVNLSYAWHITLVLFLFTFSQNFYVLMAMSPVYRKEIKRQCACLPWCRTVERERFDVNKDESFNEQETRDI